MKIIELKMKDWMIFKRNGNKICHRSGKYHPYLGENMHGKTSLR